MNALVNFSQTPQERREKYHLAKSLGCNCYWANVMRDWRLSKIERLFHLVFPEHKNNAPIMAPYAQFLLPGFTISSMGKLQGIPNPLDPTGEYANISDQTPPNPN